MQCAVITILNMILSTILLLYDFVGIYLLWLTSIPTVNKDLNKLNKNSERYYYFIIDCLRPHMVFQMPS